MYISYNIFLMISLEINNFNLLSNKRNEISLSINYLKLFPIQNNKFKKFYLIKVIKYE